MPDLPHWAKGTTNDPGVFHLTLDGHRTLCFDVLVKPAGSINPWPTCRSCEAEYERLQAKGT